MHPPQKVMGQFLMRWGFEGYDVATLRVDRGHHMLDRAVFSAGIHALQHDEQSVAAIGVEPILQAAQLQDQLLRLFFGGLLVSIVLLIVACFVRIIIFEREAAVLLYPVPFHGVRPLCGHHSLLGERPVLPRRMGAADGGAMRLRLLWDVLCAAKADVWIMLGGVALRPE